MKKWYRIGICLVLTICLLLLTACQGEPAASVSDPTQLTIATNGSENTAAQDNESSTSSNAVNSTENINSQENEKLIFPETLDFQWSSSFFERAGSLALNDISGAERVTHQRLQDLATGLSLLYDTLNPEGKYQTALLGLYKTTYTEEFFKDHSLIIIPAAAKNAALEITDVHYANGVLSCSVKTWLPPEDKTANLGYNIFYGWSFDCFVEIDVVLPEGTQIVYNFTEEQLDSAAYNAKLDNFREKCIYYYHSLYDNSQ